MPSIPVGLAAGIAAVQNALSVIVSSGYFAFDGNPGAARAYPSGSELACVRPSGTEPGVTAQGDDRDHG